MTEPSTHAEGRRPKSAKARNRAVLGTAAQQPEFTPSSGLAGDFKLSPGRLWRAPPWPGQAQLQSRPALQCGEGCDGIMTCRSALALRLEAGIWAWSRARK